METRYKKIMLKGCELQNILGIFGFLGHGPGSTLISLLDYFKGGVRWDALGGRK